MVEWMDGPMKGGVKGQKWRRKKRRRKKRRMKDLNVCRLIICKVRGEQVDGKM
jgi:hypothetical protein